LCVDFGCGFFFTSAAAAFLPQAQRGADAGAFLQQLETCHPAGIRRGCRQDLNLMKHFSCGSLLKTSYRVKVSAVFRGEHLSHGIFAACDFIPSTARRRGAFLVLFL
jgi:hypothetical protein